MLRHLAALALASVSFTGCAPSAVCGEGPACADGERCAADRCVAESLTGVAVVAFTASPGQVSAGAKTTLSWTTSNAASCALEPSFGSVPRTGSVEAYPERDTTFTLTCEGEGGPVEAEATVRVVGSDGGPALDAGFDGDGGSGNNDGGSGSDGGSGNSDAGTRGDAGVLGDAGSAGDAGPPVVVSTGISVIPAPTSVTTAAQEGPILFREQEGMLLAGSEMCDALYPGVWGPPPDDLLASDEERCQPKPGLILDSWLLHIEGATGLDGIEGTLTFSRDIVAVDWRASTLADGDLAYGAPGTSYSTSASRELDVDIEDLFEISNDRRVLSFRSGSDVDELRILVDASPSGQLLYTWTVDLEGASDLTLDARQDNNHLLLLDEGTKTLSADLGVDATGPIRIEADADLVPATLSAGTELRSWLLHFDPATVSGNARNVPASITFPRPILGVIVHHDRLLASDPLVGASGVIYDTSTPSRGLELQGVDFLWWSEDGRSVRMQLGTPPNLNSIDEVRVLTEP